MKDCLIVPNDNENDPRGQLDKDWLWDNLINNINDEMFFLVRLSRKKNEDDPGRLWQNINNHFVVKAKAQILTLESEIYAARPERNEGIIKFVDRLRLLYSNLEQQDGNVGHSDHRKITKLLDSVPNTEPWYTFKVKTVTEQTLEAAKTFDEIVEQMKQLEIAGKCFINKKEDSTDAFRAQPNNQPDNPRRLTRPCMRCGAKGNDNHHHKDCPHIDKACEKCTKIGHLSSNHKYQA
eukprot:Pgem_evm1s4860